MNLLLSIFRANDGLTFAVALSTCFAVVLLIGGGVMKSFGASLRPIIFLGVLFAPLGLSFLVVELIRARKPVSISESHAKSSSHPGPLRNSREFFGSDIPVESIHDAKRLFPEFLGQAEEAAAAVLFTGETVLVARFATTRAANDAASYYRKGFQLTSTSGDAERGWRGQRTMTSDFVEVFQTGQWLFVWTAFTPEVCAARRANTWPLIKLLAPEPTPREPLFAGLQPLANWFSQPSMKVVGIFLMVSIYVVWFFKGSTWASSSPPRNRSDPISAAELTTRLGNINDLSVPFRIEPGSEPNEQIALWRFSEVKWVDHARAHGVRRAFRIRMTLDERNHCVRATDDITAYDWSAGRNGANVEWKTMSGIVFYQHERGRVFGVSLDDHGQPRPDLSYSYRFNLQEMKSPIIDMVTAAGWTWRPVVWQGPTWLRWLTE